VLRVFARDGSRRDMELALLVRVGASVPVPDVLWSGDVLGLPAMLVSHVDGVLVDAAMAGGSVDDAAPIGRAVGAALADVHQISFAHNGFFDATLTPVGNAGMGPGQVRAYADSLLHGGPAGQVLGPELAAAWWQLIDNSADRLSAVDGQSRLVHADYNGKNILVRPSPNGWRVSAVLDWEFAFAGPPLVDVGNMLRFLAPQTFSDSFVDGYRAAGGELVDGWREIAAVLDVFGLVGLLRPGGGLTDRVIGLVREQAARGRLWP